MSATDYRPTTTDYRLPPCRIRAEHTHHLGHRSQVVESARQWLLGGLSDDVQIECVLPWTSLDRPRLDLGEVDVDQREGAEGSEQRAGLVGDTQDERRLPAPGGFRPSKCPDRS